MNLRVARVAESGAPLVCAPYRGAVRTFGVRGQVVDVAIAACAEHHRVGQMRFDRARYEVPRDNASGLSIADDQFEHFRSRKHPHFSRHHLAQQRLIRSQQKLLARLAAGVERS